MSAQHFYLTISNPRPGDDVGQVEEGRYIVKRGTVILTDRNGTPLGEDKREIERDALSTAKQMLRARLSRRPRSDFGRTIIYPKVGVA